MNNRQNRGRHRQPSKVAVNAAAFAAGATIPGIALSALSGTAYAATPVYSSPTGGWGPIIDCESGGDATAQNPTSSASGLFQMLDSTWQGLGGEGSAKDASAAEQYRMAEKLYDQRGLEPWSSSKDCWDDEVSKAKALTTLPTTPPPAPAPVKPAPVPVQPRVVVPEPPAARTQTFPVVPPESRPTLGVGDGNYTVVPGDTLSQISAARGADWQQVYQDNRDIVENPHWIFPGERLNVPGTVVVPSAVEMTQPLSVIAPTTTVAKKTAPPAPAANKAPTLADKLASQISTGFGGVKANTARVGHLIQGLFGVDTVYGIGDRAHPSDHPNGMALDFMVNRATGDRIADFLLRNADVLNVKYVIWRQRYNDGSGWDSMEDRGSVTENHYDHVHVSFK